MKVGVNPPFERVSELKFTYFQWKTSFLGVPYIVGSLFGFKLKVFKLPIIKWLYSCFSLNFQYVSFPWSVNNIFKKNKKK